MQFESVRGPLLIWHLDSRAAKRGTAEQKVRAAQTIVQTEKNRRARAAAFYLALRLRDGLFWLSFRRCEACWPLEATLVDARAARYAQTSVHVESHIGSEAFFAQ